MTVNGKHYRDHAAPLHEVGALLEARSVHTGRSAYHHLLALAQTHGIPKRRVHELIDLVGLHEVADKRAGQFSLGMGQRLGIATALLGDPSTLLLDEPVNGLDPEGIHWIRNLLKDLAAEGRTVFVSSHLMSEMALTADHLIVIGRGKLIADTSVDDFVARASAKVVLVRSPELQRLREVLERPGVTFEGGERGSLEVHGLTTEQVGDAAAEHGIAIHELTPQQASLEEAFMSLTRDSGRVRLARADAGGGRRMSTLAPAQVVPRLEHTGRVTQLRVFLSELTKLRSVRSTKWSLFTAFVLTIGVPAIAAAVFSHHWPQASPHDRADFHPLELTFVGVQISQLAIGVLGVLVITAEYSTGMIRASMTAVPAPPAGALGQGGRVRARDAGADDAGGAARVRRLAGNPLRAAHQHRLHPSPAFPARSSGRPST